MIEELEHSIEIKMIEDPRAVLTPRDIGRVIRLICAGHNTLGKKLTQDELATALDTTQATVSRWVNGRQRPGNGHFNGLEALAGQALSQILDETLVTEDVQVIGVIGYDTTPSTLEWGERGYSISIPRQTEYKNLTRYAVEVQTDEMGELYPMGALVCYVLFADLKRAPASGERVVAHHTRGRQDTRTIIREYHSGKDGAWLIARPAGKTGEMPEAIRINDGNVDIFGLVVMSVRPE